MPATDAQHPQVGPYITNAEVLQKTGLSTISEILRNRRLSLFGHVARLWTLVPEVPANKALLLMVNMQSRGQEAIVKLHGPDLRAVLVAPGSTLSRRMLMLLMLSHFHLYGELRSSGVMGRRNSPSGLRDDDDDVCFTCVCVCMCV